MRIKKQTALSSFIRAILLGALYAIIGEIIFQTLYYHDYLLNHYDWFIILSSIMYTLPVVLFFRNCYWYFSRCILLFYGIFSFIFLFPFSALFPLPDDNPAGGLLFIMMHGINVICIVIGVILGLIINVTLYYWSKLGDVQEIND